MSLNCLTCQALIRTDSDREYGHGKPRTSTKLGCVGMDRSWSGNLSPSPDYRQLIGRSSTAVAARKVIKKEHRRLNTIGTVPFKGCLEPRLVRSCGMRRDWSFEDLGKGCS